MNSTSAPASRYSRARSSARSRPSTARASVRAMITNSGLRTRLDRRPDLRRHLSAPDDELALHVPALLRGHLVLDVDPGDPGRLVARRRCGSRSAGCRSRCRRRRSPGCRRSRRSARRWRPSRSSVSRPTSGRPISAADVPNPVMYTAGKPASSTSRAASGSNAPGATMVCPDSSRALTGGSARARVSLPVTGCPRPAKLISATSIASGSGQVELAVLDAEGERLPFGRR